MSTGKKSVPPEPGRYRFVREAEPERVHVPKSTLPLGHMTGVTGADQPADADENSRLIRRVTKTIPVRSAVDDRALGRRAREVVAELAFAGPGAEEAYIESIRALGDAGLDAIGREFPGNVWFDRHAPFGREPLGRFVSPLAGVLFRLGDAAAPEVVRLLRDSREDVRYYAALLALDLDLPSFARPMASLMLDEDEDVARLARRFCTVTQERADAIARALEREADDASGRDPIRAEALRRMIASIAPA